MTEEQTPDQELQAAAAEVAEEAVEEAVEDILSDFDEKEVDEAAAEDEVEEVAEPTKINHRGHEVSVEQEELINLAQKGFDYEQKMGELKEEVREIEGFKALKEILDEDPAKAEKVRRIIAGIEEPEGGEERDENDGEDLFFGDDDSREENKTAGKVKALEDKVKAMEGERNERVVAEHQRDTEELIRAEVERYPALKNAGEVAFAPILGLLTLRPDADVENVVKVVADQFQQYESSIRADYVEKKTAKNPPKSPSGGATPTTVQRSSFTADDLREGHVKAAAMAFLNNEQPTGE